MSIVTDNAPETSGAPLPTDSEQPLAGTAADKTQPLPYPDATQPPRLLWTYALVLLGIHLVALLAFVPFLFTWSGLVLAIVGHFFFGMLGITVG